MAAQAKYSYFLGTGDGRDTLFCFLHILHHFNFIVKFLTHKLGLLLFSLKSLEGLFLYKIQSLNLSSCQRGGMYFSDAVES